MKKRVLYMPIQPEVRRNLDELTEYAKEIAAFLKIGNETEIYVSITCMRKMQGYSHSHVAGFSQEGRICVNQDFTDIEIQKMFIRHEVVHFIHEEHSPEFFDVLYRVHSRFGGFHPESCATSHLVMRCEFCGKHTTVLNGYNSIQDLRNGVNHNDRLFTAALRFE